MQVVLDANVLYKATLRDVCFELAFWELISIHWTKQIALEVELNLAKANSSWANTFRRTAGHITNLFPETLIANHGTADDLPGVDPKDVHVARACIVSSAEALVTFNTRDFGDGSWAKPGFQILTPDQCLMSVYGSNRQGFIKAIASLISDYTNPRVSVATFSQMLDSAACLLTAETVMREILEIQEIQNRPSRSQSPG